MTTCLIIDDSELIREIAARLIKDLGVTPLEASTAAEGVELCTANKPDIVFLDWDLPSMGALDFLRGAGTFEPEDRPKIVLCATENDHQQFTLAKAAGAAFHLLKPFDRASIEASFIEAGVIEKPAEETAKAVS